MLRDDALEQFPAALSMVESTALTVVINTWFAAYLSPQAQAQYFEMISAYCRGGNVAWISIEGNFGLNWPSPHNTSRAWRPGAFQIIVCRSGGRPEHFGWCHPHGRWMARAL